MLMELTGKMLPPTGEDDTEGAFRVFEGFLVIYQPALVGVEHYLHQAMHDMEPTFAEAYRPWQNALHDLFTGIYLTAKKIPLPDPEKFMEALRLFSFDSAIRFLHDICISCKMKMQANWSERFREHIDMLLFAANILERERGQGMSLA